MKSKGFMCFLAVVSLASCGNISSSLSDTGGAMDSLTSTELTFDEKMSFYDTYGGPCVFTWETSNLERMFGCLGNGRFSYSKVFSFNMLSYMQASAVLNIEEAVTYILTLSAKQPRDFMVIIIEIPSQISEDFYYKDYLMNYPNPKFYPQDRELWECMPYGMAGYEFLADKGLI